MLYILEQLYYTDPSVSSTLSTLGDSKLSPDELDAVWQHKLETAKSLLTKSGVGRDSTTLIADGLRQLVDSLTSSEPFLFHPSASSKITSFAHSILRERIPVTSDQVENCIKPYKYDLELDPREWELARVRAEALLQEEAGHVEGKLGEIRRRVGGKRVLDGLVRYVGEVEGLKRDIARRKAERARKGEDPVEESVPPPDAYKYNVAHLADGAFPLLSCTFDCRADTPSPFSLRLFDTLSSARNAHAFQDRLSVLHLRKLALRSKRCKAGPDEKAFCPEAFLNAVADKLAYTSVMFISQYSSRSVE